MTPPGLRVATFNALHGVAVLDPAADPVLGPLAAAVAGLRPDVVGLQEVDADQPRSGGEHQVRAVAEALGAPHWCFAPAMHGTPGGRRRQWVPAGADAAEDERSGEPTGPRYGIGLVSRLPVRLWRTTTLAAAPLWLPLLVPGRPRPRLVPVADEPRTTIAAVLDSPYGPLTVATTHLSFVPGWNVRQLRHLVRWLADLPRPLLLLGDLNLPGALPARITGWRPLARAATYPAWQPRIQFDHVLAHELPATTATATVHRLPVSDHAALTVDLGAW